MEVKLVPKKKNKKIIIIKSQKGLEIKYFREWEEPKKCLVRNNK